MVFTVGNLFFSWPRPLFFHGFGGSWYITLRIEVCSLEGSLPSTFLIENPIPSGGEFDLGVAWAYGLSKHFGRFCLDVPFLQVPREDAKKKSFAESETRNLRRCEILQLGTQGLVGKDATPAMDREQVGTMECSSHAAATVHGRTRGRS